MKAFIKTSLGNITAHKIIKWATCLALMLGLCVGLVAIEAALNHNPQQEYSNNPMGLVPIFFGWFSVLAGPCLLIRHMTLWQNKYLNVIFVLSALAAVVTNMFIRIVALDDLIYMPIVAMWFYAPCHAVIFLLECIKK